MHGRLAQEQLTNPIQKQIMSQGSITGVEGGIAQFIDLIHTTAPPLLPD